MSTVVRWLDMPCVQCSSDNMNALIDELEHSDLKKIDFYSVSAFARVYKTWCVKVTPGQGVIVRVVKSLKDIKQYSFNINQSARDDVERLTGLQCYEYVEAFFKELYGDISLFTAFSSMKNKQDFIDIKNVFLNLLTGALIWR